MKNKYYIYLLSCPIDGKPKYIGMSVNPINRLKSQSSCGTVEKIQWLLWLKENKLKPTISLLDECEDRDTAKESEGKFIKEYSSKYEMFNAKNNPKFNHYERHGGTEPIVFRIPKTNPDLKKKFDKAVKKVGATKVIISALEKHLA